MSDLDPAELARFLEKTSANLARLIKDEGLKVGAALGKSHAKAAQEQIRENAAEMQRLQDLVAEFRRQRKPLESAADVANRLADAIRRAHWGGAEVINVKMLLDIMNAPVATPDSKEN